VARSVPEWSAEQLAAAAARHYVAEAAGQVVRLIASNKLLGDPARFWGEVHDAVGQTALCVKRSVRKPFCA
jgi:hypothetical protein